jgi:hypothetical protein
MQCFEKRESENIKEKRKIYAARDFSDKYDFVLFKYPKKNYEIIYNIFKNIN